MDTGCASLYSLRPQALEKRIPLRTLPSLYGAGYGQRAAPRGNGPLLITAAHQPYTTVCQADGPKCPPDRGFLREGKALPQSSLPQKIARYFWHCGQNTVARPAMRPFFPAPCRSGGKAVRHGHRRKRYSGKRPHCRWHPDNHGWSCRTGRWIPARPPAKRSGDVPLLPPKAPAGRRGIDTGPEQGLVRIDIADTGQYGLIQKGGLDGPASAQTRPQRTGPHVQRFRAQRAPEVPALQQLRRGGKDQAKGAHIIEKRAAPGSRQAAANGR